MKKLLFALLFVTLCSAQVPWGQTQSSGDITFSIDFTDRLATSPQYKMIWLQVLTSDVNCDFYSVKITYRTSDPAFRNFTQSWEKRYEVSGGSVSVVLEFPVRRYSNYGILTGDEGRKQLPVYSGTRLPIDAQITEVVVEKRQIVLLGASSFSY